MGHVYLNVNANERNRRKSKEMGKHGIVMNWKKKHSKDISQIDAKLFNRMFILHVCC